MRPITLAVLSDLHIGTAARAKDMCPNPDQCSGVDDAYQARFLAFVEKERIVADYLILPGDVTHSAQTNEAQLASDFVIAAAKAMKVKKSKIVFVPGNHDVDWSVLKISNDPVRQMQRYGTINYTGFEFNSIMRRGEGTLLESPFLNVWDFKDMMVVGYNTSWHDNPHELTHHGRMDDSHLEELTKILRAGQERQDKLRVFLLHHHPVAYDPPAGAADFSQMVNSERCLKILQESYMDLLIHGHTHQPRFQISVRDAAHPLGILAAGAFSLQLPLEWQGKVTNQFHVVRIDGRESDTNCIKGRVESWSYYFAHGWRASVAERDGIAHTEPFGVYATPNQIRDSIRTLLMEAMMDVAWVKWTEIKAVKNSLRYSRPEAVFRALRELAEELRIIPHGDSLETLVILKREHTDA